MFVPTTPSLASPVIVGVALVTIEPAVHSESAVELSSPTKWALQRYSPRLAGSKSPDAYSPSPLTETEAGAGVSAGPSQRGSPGPNTSKVISPEALGFPVSPALA